MTKGKQHELDLGSAFSSISTLRVAMIEGTRMRSIHIKLLLQNMSSRKTIVLKIELFLWWQDRTENPF